MEEKEGWNFFDDKIKGRDSTIEKLTLRLLNSHSSLTPQKIKEETIDRFKKTGRNPKPK